ncbi:MAG: hypothetical protein NTW11_03910 [Candidatus Staskawiczbacteria bacterium]|nr:hypothetical protein [Candidatus Staskawiczbacteria bacterium]
MSDIPRRESNNLLNPDDYLRRLLDPAEDFISLDELERATPIKESLGRLDKPLAEVKYNDEGEVRINNDNINFRFVYSRVDEDKRDGIEEYLSKIPHKKQQNDIGNWRNLDQMFFNIDGADVNLLDVLPNGYKVLFCPEPGTIHGATDEKDKVIKVLGDIVTPRAIIIMLHEIGHTIDLANENRLKFDLSKKNYDVAEMIRRERTATAFAFKALKPFLKDQQFKNDVVNYLKNAALDSYYGKANELIT